MMGVEENDVPAEARSGVVAGTHVYGYVTLPGECALKRPGACLTVSTTKCHDRFVCLPCLHLHKHDLDRDGVEMKFVGVLPDEDDSSVGSSVQGDIVGDIVDEAMARVIADRDEVVKMLHEVYAVLVDRGGVSTFEFRKICDRAVSMLSDHGVSV